MAHPNNLFAQMLILAVYLASALASTSTRDPKELRLFQLSGSPFYRVPTVQFHNGVIQRQINSPIDPMIGQQGLGPFFGYFPNFLTQPCPATPESQNSTVCPVVPQPECQNCTVCPVVPQPPPPANITACDNADPGIASSAENGTITLTNTSGCKLTLTSFYPNTRIKFNCSTFSNFRGDIGPTSVQRQESLAINTNYLSLAKVLFINLLTTASVTFALECSWTNVPA